MAFEVTIPKDCDFEKWQELATYVTNLKNSSSWAFADLLVYAEGRGWRQEAVGFVIGLGYRIETIRNYLRIGKRFPPRARTFKLSFSHYMLAVGRGDEAERWLEAAQRGDAGVPWSSDQLYSKIHQKLVEKRPTLIRRAVKERVRYNRPHSDDPFAAFEAISVETAKFIREQAKLPLQQRTKMFDRVSTVLDRLMGAFMVLQDSLPADVIEAVSERVDAAG